MRATQQEQVGGAGTSEVTAAFERLGWGVVENARHDLGTDLITLARDARLFDLGLPVGVQVKAGDSYFREPARDCDDALLGWWFRDSDRSHVDAWVRHGMPHLLVLHDLDTRTSYWVHVTAEAVVSTGKGAKVLVPVANTVDEEHRDALLTVAAVTRPRLAWEGSAWTGAGAVPPRDLLRHALVVPRVVAPHPNAGQSVALTPEQAVALLVQVRVRDLAAFADKHADVPALHEAGTSPKWPWRFVGALGHRLTTGEVDVLLEMVDDAPDAATRAAATVTAAAGLVEDGRADEAIELLEATLDRDEAEPVDHAWLIVQHARACAEIGRLDEARAAAVDVQKIRMTHPDDVTATALAGVAAVLLFETSAWGDQDLEGTIKGGDTAAAWWRAQTVSHALGAMARRTFKAWARDTAMTLGGADVPNDQLVAASLIANHAGDHGGWRHLSGLLGQNTLLQLDRHADPEEARRGLTTLRLAGANDALKLAVRRLAADGPAAAVTLAAADVRLEASTRTTGPTNLALLQGGGDVLDGATADRSVTWLLAALDDSSAFTARTTPSYLLAPQLVDTLAAVVPAASPDLQRAVLDHLEELPAQEDQMTATSWARVQDALPDDAWDEPAALRTGQRADAHHWSLRLPLLGVAARFDPAARAGLLKEARSGSLNALAALGDVRKLSPEVVSSLIHRLAELVSQQIRDAQGRDGRARSYGFGGHDYGQDLALLNVWHPTAANWDPLLDLLEDDAVIGEHKRGAFHLLAALADRVPHELRARLEAIAVAVAQRPPDERWFPFGNKGDARGAAANLGAALGALDPDQAAGRLLDLLAGDADHRKWAAWLARRLGRAEDTGVLVTLTQDVEPAVRAAAAGALASLVTIGRGGPLATEALQRCLRDPGTRVPAGVAGSLADAPARNSAAEEALIHLQGHASARVRAVAATPAADQRA